MKKAKMVSTYYT